MILGFPTGKLAGTNLATVVESHRAMGVKAVEISALRKGEMQGIVCQLAGVDLAGLAVSFHLPSNFSHTEEKNVFKWLTPACMYKVPVIIHPDTMWDFGGYRELGSLVRVENMDLRTRLGQTAREMDYAFSRLPDATWCFDIGHARQVDPTMALANELYREFKGRLSEVHVSVVDPSGRHDHLTEEAMADYSPLLSEIGKRVPIIIETTASPEGQQQDLNLIAKWCGRKAKR